MSKASRAAPAINVSDDIVPIAELKAHLSALVRGLPKRGRPVVVTQNGKAAAVLISPAAFDRLSHGARFVAAVEEGLEDIEAGRVLSDGAVQAILDRRYGEPPKATKRRR